MDCEEENDDEESLLALGNGFVLASECVFFCSFSYTILSFFSFLRTVVMTCVSGVCRWFVRAEEGKI